MPNTSRPCAHPWALRHVLPAVGLLTACLVADQTGPNSGITELTIAPASVDLATSQSVQLTAQGRTKAGTTRDVQVSWSATGGAIDGNGLYTADTVVGDFAVTATIDNPPLSASARIRVRGSLKQVVLLPAQATVAPGAALQFSDFGLTARGDTVTITTTFTALNGQITSTGMYTAPASGASDLVIAAAAAKPNGQTIADTALVTISGGTSASVASVAVTPGSASIAVNGTVQLTATPKDASGNTLTGRTVSWSTSSASIATVDGQGLVTGVAAGSATITATSEGKSGTSAITVTAGSPVPVASVTVSPASASVAVNGTVQLTATPKDANGNTLSGRSITWTTSSASIATVDGNGLVTGVAGGSATITATSEEKSGTAAITVTGGTSGSGVVFVGAGDIADCGNSNDEATAQLLDNIAGTVYTTGDNAYSSGTATEFSDCYDPTWGRHKARTRPAPGNHDYNTSGAAPYYAYFGSNAGPAGRGYYSFDLGDWHIVSLNSEVSMSAGSAQETWLRADLAASSKQCTLAYWHKPRFSSGSSHGSTSSAQPLWQALYDANAEIVLAGHEHNYERFAPQTPSGQADPARGIREFVVGTGGRSHYGFGTPLANSEVRNGSTYGVLKLTLGAGTYSWQFVPVAGASFTDSGSGTCH